MSDYLIWMGEKYMAEHNISWSPKEWEKIMDICMTNDLGPEYSISAYLKEVR